jgi:hypothetical protein
MSLVTAELSEIPITNNPNDLDDLLQKQLSGDLPVFIDDCARTSEEAIATYQDAAKRFEIEPRFTYTTMIGYSSYAVDEARQKSDDDDYWRYITEERPFHVDGCAPNDSSPNLTTYFDLIEGEVMTSFVPMLPPAEQSGRWNERVIQQYESGNVEVDDTLFLPIIYRGLISAGQRLSFVGDGPNKLAHKFSSTIKPRLSTSTVFKHC